MSGEIQQPKINITGVTRRHTSFLANLLIQLPQRPCVLPKMIDKRQVLPYVGMAIVILPLLHLYVSFISRRTAYSEFVPVQAPLMDGDTANDEPGEAPHDIPAFPKAWWNQDKPKQSNAYPGPRREETLQFFQDWSKQPGLSAADMHNPNLMIDMDCLLNTADRDRCWSVMLHKYWVSTLNYLARYPDEAINRAFPIVGESDIMKNHNGKHVHGHGLWDLVIPTFPCDYNQFQRVGRSGDGGKWMCGVPTFDGCIVYSLGSNGDFSFEEDIYNKTEGKCKVFTFDCTISMDQVPKYNWLTFKPWCIGRDHIDKDNRVFMSLPNITAHFKHEKIHLLKADIEGAEFPLFDSIMDPSMERILPSQILLEAHWGGFAKLCCDTLEQKRSAFFKFLEFVKRWDDLGYRVRLIVHVLTIL